MTDSNVHSEIPHFAGHALFEGAVHWDACGCVANEVALAALTGRTPDAGLATEARARDLAAGKFTVGSGQTLADIAWDLGQRGCHDLQQIGYSGSPDLNALHDFIKRATLAQIPVIIEVANASALPDNEAGVHYHFVVLGGIDSVAGYLVANGDTRTGIANQSSGPAYGHFPGCGNLPTNWATWQTLVNAGICGAIALKPIPPLPAPVEPAPVSAPVAPPQVAQALALVEQASTLIAGVQGASAASQALTAAAAAIQAL